MDQEYYKNVVEIWKDIVGYEGFYQVSDFGRIKSFIKHNNTNQRILKPSKTPKGFHVILCKNGNRRSFKIHKLVIEAFIGPCPPEMEVCHNDGNPGNNKKENLRYDTHKNNIKDKIQHGTLLYGEKCPWSKVDSEQVIEIRELVERGDLTQKQIGKMFNIKQNTVSSIKSYTNRKRG